MTICSAALRAAGSATSSPTPTMLENSPTWRATTHCGWRVGNGLAELGGRLRRIGAIRAGWRDEGGRSAAALFHVRHDRQAQAGVAQPAKLPDRPSRDDVLARFAARGHPPQHLFPGLGKARLQLLLCPVERCGDGLHAEPAAVQRQGLLDAIAGYA